MEKFATAIVLALVPALASALPSFATQTGMPCVACHTTAFGPSLTPAGETFKRLGYTAGTGGTALPLNVMAIASFTNTASRQGAAPAGFSANDNGALDSVSLVYAGRIAGPVGALAEVAYDGVAHEARWGKVDVRYAGRARAASAPFDWGVSLNNGPSVQDLWNTSPAWTYPFVSSGVAPVPAATPLIEGRLEREVYGLSAYSLLQDYLYAELGGYRSLPGDVRDLVHAHAPDRIERLAPYWRLGGMLEEGAYAWRIGAFGMRTPLCPDDDCTLGTDDYLDFAYDLTYLQRSGADSLKLQMSYTQERQQLDASAALGRAANGWNRLRTWRGTALVALRESLTFTASGFAIEGTSDAGLYAPAPVRGSANGSPDSGGAVAEVAWGTAGIPVTAFQFNYRVGLQYTWYDRFNGAHSDYDGFGRDAADNDTLYAYLWVAL